MENWNCEWENNKFHYKTLLGVCQKHVWNFIGAESLTVILFVIFKVLLNKTHNVHLGLIFRFKLSCFWQQILRIRLFFSHYLATVARTCLKKQTTFKNLAWCFSTSRPLCTLKTCLTHKITSKLKCKDETPVNKRRRSNKTSPENSISRVLLVLWPSESNWTWWAVKYLKYR